MKLWLFLLTGLWMHQSTAQSVPAPLLSLPETGLHPIVATAVLPVANGVRYQYQLLHVEIEQRIWLAPSWQGNTKLEPRTKLFNPAAGELDQLLMATINGLVAEGWELLEIQTTSQPTQAKQTIETSLSYNDPNRPTYTGTTTIHAETHPRYLFRRPLSK